MKAEYDLSKLKARKNPYASKLKKPVTMRLSEDVVEYFKRMADETGLPYQNLINLYLRDCAESDRKLNMKWECFLTNASSGRVQSNAPLKHVVSPRQQCVTTSSLSIGPSSCR